MNRFTARILLSVMAWCQSVAAFDIVIVSHYKDYETLPLCIASIKKYIPGFDRIFVIGNRAISSDAFMYIDETTFYRYISPSHIKTVWQQHNPALACRAPWVFQQFLKLGAPLIIEDLSEDYVCIDADIVWLGAQRFVNEKGQILYSKNRACSCCGKGLVHYEYVHMYKKLVGDRRTPMAKFSFIAHHMLFRKKIVKELLAHIEQLHGKPWYDAIIAHLNFNNESNFSEYELYGNWLWNKHPELLAHRQLQWVDANDLDMIAAYQGYDFVSAQYYKRYNHTMGYPID